MEKLYKTKLKKDDKVIILAGNNKSTPENVKEGKVVSIDLKKGRAIVEGMNIRKVAIKKTKSNQKPSGFTEKEMPIHLSNLMYSDQGTPVKLGYKYDENKKKVRFIKKTDKIIEK